MNKLKPSQIVILGFLIVICIGTVVLSLSKSSSDGVSIGLLDAFFTSTSATCVAGLMVRDTGADFSMFGQTVILLLIQIGGLGIMTVSTFFAILLGRTLTIRENVVIKGAIDHYTVEGLRVLILYILGITLFIETIGAVLLHKRFESIFTSIFHSVSAFCNAGISLNTTSLMLYRNDIFVNAVITGLIILGGIGFIVLIDVPKVFKWLYRKYGLKKDQTIRHLLSKISLQTKIAVSVSAILLIVGSLLFFVLENYNALDGLGLREKVLTSFFQSTTARSAGFNTVPIDKLTSPTLFFLIMLMFIGSSPGSTGGGIKTCTLGILIVGIWSMIRNRENIHIFRKRIPKDIFIKAMIITGIAVAWIVIFTMILSFVESREQTVSNYFLRILFEVTSAFGTVGLSTGITSILSPIGKILIMITMFVGRIGPLTVALALALREKKVSYRYPSEKVMVG